MFITIEVFNMFSYIIVSVLTSCSGVTRMGRLYVVAVLKYFALHVQSKFGI